jgi:excisionase family DNA binding protein
MTDEILTIRDAAELLKINEKTAYKLALAGKSLGFKVRGSRRLDRQEIANWIKRKLDRRQVCYGGSTTNEADTCRKFVMPKLQSAGWDNDPQRSSARGPRPARSASCDLRRL